MLDLLLKTRVLGGLRLRKVIEEGEYHLFATQFHMALILYLKY